LRGFLDVLDGVDGVKLSRRGGVIPGGVERQPRELL
jgi:hypothetical protein